MTMKDFDDFPGFMAIQALENSPSFKAMQALENSPSFKAMQAMENSPSFKAMQDMENSSFFKVMQTLENSSAMRTFSGLTDRLSSLNAGKLTLGEAYQEVVRRHEHASVRGFVDPFDIVADEVEGKVKHAVAGPLSTEFYVNLILAFFLFYLSQISSTHSEERIISRLESVQALVVQQLSELRVSEEVYTFYVVERPVNLRTRPNTKSKVLTPLYPNAKVQLIEKDSMWVKVQYFDHLEDTHRSGWVFKKYLKILNPKYPKRKSE
jgi:SH3 domain-containing protein